MHAQDKRPQGSGWFANLSVGRKLAALIGAGAVAVGAVGWSGTVALDAVHDRATALYSQAVVPLDDVANVRSETAQMRILALKHGLAQDAAAKAKYDEQIRTEDAQLDRVVTETSAVLSKVPGTAKDVEGYTAALKAWRLARDQDYLPASNRFDVAAANGVLDNEMNKAGQAMADSLNNLFTTFGAQAKAAAAKADDSFDQGRVQMLVALAIGILGSVALGTVITRRITRPLGRAVNVIGALAKGDLRPRTNLASRDEIGTLGSALDDALDQLSRTVGSIGSGAGTLATAARELAEVSRELAAGADEASAQATSVSVGAEEVNASIAAVASGTEEMGASIREIARSSSEAAGVARDAVALAEHAGRVIGELDVATTQINEVVDLISSIAAQTNLLALNATIEAARAGSAGKGFAVVADEVKVLAQETSQATGRIGGQVTAIQSATRLAVDAIRRVSDGIARVNDHQTSIAGSVEQQAATTDEMARSVTEATGGTGSIAASATGVATAASHTSSAAGTVDAAAGRLTSLASELQQLVATFQH